MSKLLGWRGVGFVVSWTLLVALLMRLTAMQVLAQLPSPSYTIVQHGAMLPLAPGPQGEEMFSFNPFKILEIEEGATPNEIKKAYRRMSLQVWGRTSDVCS